MTRQERRKLRNQAAHLPEISLIPLIDTVLVLLVIFMVSVPVVHQAMKIRIPQSGTGDAKGKANDLFIGIDERKNMYINNDRVTQDQLVKVLQSKMKDPHQFVFVSADENLPWKEISNCVAELKRAGIKNVAFSTKPFLSRTA